MFVKRVIGMPGDHIDVRNGAVLVNGEELDEPYVAAGDDEVDPYVEPPGSSPVTVPDGEYYVLGDNRGWSCDSRHWGTAPREAFIARVVGRYWPPQRIGGLD